jgi:hypothetical protein
MDAKRSRDLIGGVHLQIDLRVLKPADERLMLRSIGRKR